MLDLATAEGQTRAAARSPRRAHALVTNLRPAAIRKLGLTYDASARLRTRGSSASRSPATAWTAPYADRPAYDYVIQALTGVMAMTGEPDGPPTKTGYSAVDNSAGMMGALGLLAKIVEGKGGQIDIAMYDVMLSQLNYLAGAWLNAGERAAAPRALGAPVHRAGADLRDRATAGSCCSSPTTTSGAASAARRAGPSGWRTRASRPWRRAIYLVMRLYSPGHDRRITRRKQGVGSPVFTRTQHATRFPRNSVRDKFRNSTAVGGSSRTAVECVAPAGAACLGAGARRACYTRSMMVAIPCPKPMHIVCSP